MFMDHISQMIKSVLSCGKLPVALHKGRPILLIVQNKKSREGLFDSAFCPRQGLWSYHQMVALVDLTNAVTAGLGLRISRISWRRLKGEWRDEVELF